jgi:tRNA G46 methylase TrmB
VFGRSGRVEVEIGIGKGRFSRGAELRTRVLHFGIEWANEFLRIAETAREKRGLENVASRAWTRRELVRRAVPELSVAAYYVFYPTRGQEAPHKRRFSSRQTSRPWRGRSCRTAAPRATDHEEYWGSSSRSRRPPALPAEPRSAAPISRCR